MKPSSALQLPARAPQLPRPQRYPEHHSAPPATPAPWTVRGRLARFVGRNWARVGYGYLVEPTWLEINSLEIGIQGLPPAFAGLKIAHLTDFHCGPHIPVGFFEEAIARTIAAKPDIIALTGDFIHKGYRHVQAAAQLFRELRAPHGVYAVLGNHDFSVRNALGIRRHPGLHQAVADALGSKGVKVLRNETVRLERESQSLLLAGVDDLWSRQSDPHAALNGSCPRTPRVILAHNPQTVEHFGEQRFDLMLSGHTHGGQINWPGFGRVLLGRQAKRWAAGLYSHGNGHVYVNKGIGFGWRFRFGVRPEIAFLTLTPKSDG